MSQIEKSRENRTLNVEGILANFFLEKLEMQDSKSSDDSDERRRKKHKKHKSKKSKHRRRSRSSERKTKVYLKCVADRSSSEEKDIRRLQRLKKLDTKDKCNVSSLPISGTENSNDTFKDIASSSVQNCILPETTLETHSPEDLVTNELNEESKNISSKGNKLTQSEDLNIKSSILSSLEVNASETNSDDLASTLNSSKNDQISSAIPATLDIVSINSDNQKPASVDVSNVEKPSTSDENKMPIKHSRSRSKSPLPQKKSEKRYSRSRSRSRSRFKSKRRKRSSSRSRSRSSSRSRSRRTRRSRSRSKEYKKRSRDYSERKRSSSTSRRRHRSYSRSKSKERFSSRSRNRRQRHRSRSHSHDRSRRSPSESYRYSSKSRKKRDSSVEYDSKSKSKKHSRSNSIENEKDASKSHKIDQAKILQLAQKNVLNMIEKGTLPEGLSLENFKKDQLVSFKSGGKSVQELTDFCTKLSKRENDPPDKENDKAGGNDDVNKESGFIHHPFKIKETSSIKLNIKNAVQIPTRTHAEKFADTARLSSQFPVSSGNQHKQKELEWIPVEPPGKTTKSAKDNKAVVPVSQTATDLPVPPEKNTAKETVNPSENSEPLPSVNPITVPLPASETPFPSLPPPPLPPALPPLPPPPPPLPLNNTLSYCADVPPPNVTLATNFPTAPNNVNSLMPICNYPVVTENIHFSQPSASIVYPSQPLSMNCTSTISNFNSKKPVDVTAIVSQRFKALTQLQGNPNDPEALHALEEAQANIQNWVQSQQVPGLFTGSTGAKLLSVEELCGPRHWNYRAKKDFLTRAAPVTEGKGMSLLKKMGWNPGEGLGKNKEGSLEPLVLDIKMDKKGLVSEGEGSKKIVSSVLKDLQGKHPVSALMELCSKRKWKPPLYTVIKESGPPHKKLFLFKVEVNNVEYQSATPINNKKVAKADAAVICLQALSVFPKT